MSVTWAQALAWRTHRHLLDPVGEASVAEVVRRLGAVLATDEALAELAVGARRAAPAPGDLGRALDDGELVKVAAFRGAVHYLSADDGGAYLALRGAGRQWELPSWQRHYGLGPADWPAFRDAVREALAAGPCTLPELGASVTGRAAFRHLRAVFDDGADTLVKPLMWQGDMGYGRPRDGRATFRSLPGPRWAGVWELDEAGPHAVRSYLRAYGPATPQQVHRWLGNGLSAGRKRLQGWLAQLDDELEAVDVDGERTYVLAEDVDELRAARPTPAVRLLPGHDQWVMGPGTGDEHVVPAAHRTAVTRRANLVVAGGVVRGTWSTSGGDAAVTWSGSGAAPVEAVEEQVERIATITGRPLRVSLRLA